ncbi:MAG: hypothetical protein AB1529_04485 [Candidatus Micrarchaeota archaeon]
MRLKRGDVAAGGMLRGRAGAPLSAIAPALLLLSCTGQPEPSRSDLHRPEHRLIAPAPEPNPKSVPLSEDIRILGNVDVKFGCQDNSFTRTLQSESADLYESGCSMEVIHKLPDGGRTMVRFDTLSSGERGMSAEVLMSGELSAVITDRYVLTVDRAHPSILGSTNLALPARTSAHAFDPETRRLFLRTTDRIYVTDLSDSEGRWRKSMPRDDIRDDAVLAYFGGALLVIQSGEVPVLAFRGVAPENRSWTTVAYKQSGDMEGPFAVSREDGLAIRYQNGVIRIRLDEHGTVSVERPGTNAD